MNREPHIAQLARAQAREALTKVSAFGSLPRADQLAMYRQMVDDRVRALEAGSRTPAKHSRAKAGIQAASTLIDDKRHENRRIEQAGELAGDFVDSVDFPKFVRDLLKGVFDANLEVTLKQMDAYQTLLKTASQSLAKFINAIDDAASFAYLAENNSDDFGLSFDEDEKNDDGSPKPVLVDKAGEPVALDDNAIKAKIMDAKIAMAKEQRAMLRETILMGITRLVVEKGVVKASVVFDIKASEKIQKQDKAANKRSSSSGSSVSASGGLIGSIFGGPKGGHTRSDRETQISISSAKSLSSTDMSAKVMGSVEINFKSDYFKLDNFAALYGQGQDGGAPMGGGGGGGMLPAGAPAAAGPPKLPPR